MTATTLRAAATKMRENAEAATGGPWESDLVNTLPIVFNSAPIPRPVVYDQELRVGDAEHIAGMDPTVALAVAAWLEATATGLERRGVTARIRPDEQAALAVARTYLGADA